MLEAKRDPVTKTQVEAIQLDKVLQQVTKNYEKMDNTSLNYLLVCLAKIRVKTTNDKIRSDIIALLNKMRNSTTNLFLRVKAQQMLDLTNLDESVIEEVFAPLPEVAIDIAFKEYNNKFAGGGSRFRLD